jgi:hypothetical protein
MLFESSTQGVLKKRWFGGEDISYHAWYVKGLAHLAHKPNSNGCLTGNRRSEKHLWTK